MPSFHRTRPNEALAPDFIELPDGRKRLVRYFSVANGTAITDALIEPYGTADHGDATGGTASFASLRLVDQRLVKLGAENLSYYQKTYEELPATAEVQVGGATTGNTQIRLPDGRVQIEAEFLQLASAAYTPGTVGITTAPGNTLAWLEREECTVDGAVRRIKRTYVYEGQVSQRDETKNNGALLLRTIVHVRTGPSTPVGYTLVSYEVTPKYGLPIVTAVFAKGEGQISQDDETKNNGALLLRTVRHLSAVAAANPISTPSGYTKVSENYTEQDGYRVWSATYAKGDGQISQDNETKNNGFLLLRTVRYLTAPGAGNPIGTPSGYVPTSATYEDRDGHRIWTATFASGNGQIAQEDETKNNGMLLLRTIRHLTEPNLANPIATPTYYTALSANYTEGDGYRIWTATFARGFGLLSQDDETKNNGALLLQTIRHLSAPAAANPFPTPIGYTKVSENYTEQDGHRIWSATYAQGSGEISRDISYAQSSDQGTTGITRTTIRYLVAPSATVQPTSLAGSVEVGRTFTEAEGHRIWTTVWAKGTGLVSSTVDKKNGDKLRVYRRVALGSVPSAPTGGDTLGGTVTLIEDTSREQDGFVLYERTWAEGVGVIGESREVRAGGLVIVGKDILTAPGTTDISSYAPSGILLEQAYQDLDGYRRFSASWMQSSSGGDPASGTAASYQGYVPFTYPGRAKYFYTAFTTGGYTSHRAHDVFLSPPVETRVLATTVITYKPTATVSASYTIWNPSDWATLTARWIGWFASPRSKVEGLRGYRAVNSGASGTDATAGVGTSLFGDRVYSGTDWEIALSGGPADPGGNTYTLHVEIEPAFAGADGTQYYRQLEIYATIPAQSALPV